MMPLTVKICGLKTESAVKACVANGADYLGFNFFPKSPRYITPQVAASLAPLVPEHIKKVALFVDAEDDYLRSVLSVFKPDLLQLHGTETPDRIARIKKQFLLPVIKAFGIREDTDLEEALMYGQVADYFLFDARPPAGADIPGGNAQPFDWSLLKGRDFLRPWFLAGGLNAENVAKAVALSGARMLDIASGVERARGEKDEALIATFLDTAKGI